MKNGCLTLLVLISSLSRIEAAANAESEGEQWWAYVEKLADDHMEGRLTGSEAYTRAAGYVAGEFARSGLRPAGVKGFFQPIKFSVRRIREELCSLEIVRDGQAEPLSLAEDANFGLPADMAETIEAPAVFVGHGLVIPELGIDDLAGQDLKGKIALYLSGGPKFIPGPIKAHYSATKQRWQALHRAGAVGVAALLNPKSSDVPWSRSTLARLQPTMSLTEKGLNDAAGMKISLRINPANADKFLAGTGHNITELLKLADEDKPLPRFPLQLMVRARMATRKSTVSSMNVAALLPGSDPLLKNEYVVMSAHLAHLGIGEPINGDKIYNGAMDNAAGVASLLQIAHWLSSFNRPPKRSVLFLAVTGEEKGLLGSKYFANHPTVPNSAIVAEVNIDMFLPLFPLKQVVVFGLDESTLGDRMRSVCSGFGIQPQSDPEPDRNGFIRSDQYSFIQRGIPALAFGFGCQADSPEQKLIREWLKTRYHAPSDDLQQPVNKQAAAQFNHVALALVERIADDPERPSWKASSFFRRFAGTDSAKEMAKPL
jgi:hypothetical protein